jgi:hypothetical protein
LGESERLVEMVETESLDLEDKDLDLFLPRDKEGGGL